MSPALVTFLLLACLYTLGRVFQHHGHEGHVLNPSRCEHLHADDEPMDTWAELWEERFAEDELEAWWQLPAKERA